MAGFADLVLTASNTKGGALSKWRASQVEGATWKWTVKDIKDGAGDAIDLSSATCAAAILTAIDGTTLISVGGTPALTFTGGVGEFSLSATSSATAGLAAAGTGTNGRACVWFCKITSGSNIVYFWNVTGSPFVIYPAGV
jgi:hypothetical protein